MNQKLSFSTNTRWLVVEVWLFFATLSVSMAQTSSAIDIIPSITSTYEMVKACEWNDQNYLVCYSKGSGGHFFELINTATGAVRKVPFQIGTTGAVSMNGITGHQIYDMDVDEGYCYFCGEEGWIQQGVPSSIGFVGRFSLSDVLAGSGNMDIYRVAATSMIKRIAVAAASRLQIFALAEVPADPRFLTVYETYNTTCLVEIMELNGTMYSYVVAPLNSSEVFQDLDMVNGGVVVVSKFLRNSQSFCLRNMKQGSGAITDGINWTSIQNGSIYTNSNTPRTYRPEYDPILIDGNSDFVVAHAVDSNGTHGVATYRMDLVNIGVFAMNDARYWSSTSHESILDLSVYAMWQAALLTTDGSTYRIRDVSDYNTSVSFSCASTSYKLNSLSSLHQGRFYSVGHNSSNKFCYIGQMPGGGLQSCLQMFVTGSAALRMPTQRASEGLWIVQYRTLQPVDSVSFHASSTIHQSTCNH